MRRLRLLTNRHRAPSTNQMLGMLLAFNAGAVNAGGFLLLRLYTSHMTGFTSQIGDGLVLGNRKMLLNAIGALTVFVLGAAVSSILVNWGRQHRLHAVYALPLLLEATLMLLFGLVGAITLTWSTPFAVPITVLLLSFIMGLQNAVMSKASRGAVRTTHMTGNVTDLGVELGKLFYWNGRQTLSSKQVHHNSLKLTTAACLLSTFMLGGIAGAFGFKHIGFVCVIPLAALLWALSLPPLFRDISRLKAAMRSAYYQFDKH